MLNYGHMAPRTAREAAEVLDQRGLHSHLHSEGETTCISARCTLAATVLGTSLLRPADTRPSGFTTTAYLAGSYL